MLSIANRQMNLKFLNFYKGNVDNQEGAKTKQSYKDFQKAYGLVVDGIYGTKTDAKLVAVIKEIQSFLKVNADGIAGQMTSGTAKQWQISQGLTADGIFGEKSRARMAQYLNSWDSIKHFTKSEFNCPCCGKNNIQIALVKNCENIRNKFNAPTVISSGTRCVKHNSQLKGSVPNSRHLDGKAADLTVIGVNGATLLAYTKSLVSQGLLRYTYRIKDDKGNYTNYVHIDIY